LAEAAPGPAADGEPAVESAVADGEPAGEATVNLPRSLVALFPGCPRKLQARGATVADVVADLDRQVPGIANRVLDAGPSLRRHLNVFVSGERAALETRVPPGAIVHVIPAVSGG
jgi:molybdopterin converting factor small subunit